MNDSIWKKRTLPTPSFSIKGVRIREKLEDKILATGTISNKEVREYTQEMFGHVWEKDNYTEKEKEGFDKGVKAKHISHVLEHGKMEIKTDDEIRQIQKTAKHDWVENFMETLKDYNELSPAQQNHIFDMIDRFGKE